MIPNHWRAIDLPALLLALALAVTTATAAPMPDRSAAATIPATDDEVALRLTGIVAHPAADYWCAIIADRTGSEGSYSVGSALAGEWTLAAIAPHHVVLRRGRRDVVLGFDGATAGARRIAIAGATKRAGDATPGDSSVTLPLAVRAAPALLLQWLPIEPQTSGDRLVGWRVGEADDETLMRALGLQPGDLLTAINAVPLASSDSDHWALARPSASGRLELTVFRDGAYRLLAY
jgi:general secretion pathway protein C